MRCAPKRIIHEMAKVLRNLNYIVGTPLRVHDRDVGYQTWRLLVQQPHMSHPEFGVMVTFDPKTCSHYVTPNVIQGKVSPRDERLAVDIDRTLRSMAP